MKRLNKLMLCAFLLIPGPVIHLSAQDKSAVSRTTISVETDPATFAFKGYAVHLRIKPAKSKQLVIGAGTYAMNFPDLFVNMNPDNKNKNWNVRINNAFSLFAEYYFKEANSKWFAGLQTGIQNYRISNKETGDKKSRYSNVLIMPSLGYTWHPFPFPLYVKPWAGIGYAGKIAGENSVDHLNYKISPIIPFATLHVGYLFRK